MSATPSGRSTPRKPSAPCACLASWRHEARRSARNSHAHHATWSSDMKYIDEFRDGDIARKIADRLRAEARPERQYSFMEFCGGHTHAISRYGIAELLPPNAGMVHGPGCPGCVLPIARIDLAI